MLLQKWQALGHKLDHGREMWSLSLGKKRTGCKIVHSIRSRFWIAQNLGCAIYILFVAFFI